MFHVKYGREHCHVVWSRINPDTMRAVQLSFDRQNLRTLTQEFARDHGIQLPPGMQQNRLKDRFNNRIKLENLAEKQQEERTGISKAERMDAITAAWRESDSSKSFIAALETRGYFLARGDQRTFVVVDLYGEIHALARQIEGVKTKDVKARLVDVALEKLPDATKAQDFARAELERQRAAAPQSSKAAAGKMRDDLTSAQRERRAALDQERKDLFAQHRSEEEALAAAQDAEKKGVLSARLRAQPKGVIAFIARITGIKLLIAHRHKKQDLARDRDHAAQKLALYRRHRREMLQFQHRYRGLTSLEMRERRSLETALRREQFRMIAHPQERTPREARNKQEQPRPQQALTAEQRQRLEAIRNAGLDLTAPAAAARKRSASRLARGFEKAATEQKKPEQKGSETAELPAADALEEIRKTAEEITKQQQELQEKDSSRGVRGSFNRAARDKDRARDSSRRHRQPQARKPHRNGPAWMPEP